MKKFLLLINLILALAAGGTFLSNISRETQEAIEEKQTEDAKALAEAEAAESEPEKAPSADELVTLIANANIFDPERAPRANAPAGNRTEMTLAGTFQIGDKKGAIVILNYRENTQNPFLTPIPRPTNIPEGNSMRRRLPSPEKPNSFAMGNRQSVLVGETLANGYTLQEVKRSSVVVVCGSDRRELPLGDPTAVVAQVNRSYQGRPRLNASQQLQAAQVATMRELMGVMRSINQRGGLNGRRR